MDEMMHPPSRLLSIIIVSFNTRDVTRECLQRVFAYGADLDMEVIVVDNASRDDSVAMIKAEFPQALLLQTVKNQGFAGGNNVGIRLARGRFVLLLNSDAYLFPDTLATTLKAMEENPGWGILGVKLVGTDDSPQPSARMLPTPWSKFLVISGIASRFPHSRLLGGPDYPWWDHASERVVGWVPGAFFLVRREVFDAIGLLNEKRYFLYFEEIEFCKKSSQAGWPVIFFPHARCIHLGGQSSAATGKVTKAGRQLTYLRVQSEFRYCRANFGLCRVVRAAGVELMWKGVVRLKNSLQGGAQARIKREDAAQTMELIMATLKNDGFGRELTGAGMPAAPPERHSALDAPIDTTTEGLPPEALQNRIVNEDRKLWLNIRRDLRTHFYDWGRQGFWVMQVYRFGRWRYTINSTLLRKPWSLLYKFLYKMIQILTGIEFPCEVPVGRDFRIDHFGDIIVSGFAAFGDNCVIRNGVTVGLKREDDPCAPQFGNKVNIGTGAKVLGRITIGNNVDIGANTVLLQDVPDDYLAVGTPARLIAKNKSTSPSQKAETA
jgi:GT2 family glycosyltransferase/serine acetyltransferase